MTVQQTHTANAQHSYTLASHTSQRTDQSLPKSMPAPTQEKYEVFTNIFENNNDVSKIQNIFSCPSKKIKHPTRRPTRQRHGNSTTTTMVYKDGGQNASTQQRFCIMAGAMLRMTVLWWVQVQFFDCTFVLKFPAFGNTQNVIYHNPKNGAVSKRDSSFFVIKQHKTSFLQ